nr:tRNA (adenosine(37)-N6)-dimethylallyltransferase MiaA [Chthonobacter albigriseus]
MGHEGRPRAVLIAGPTASGKSALAMAVAERIDGVIVNADSMQVYRELRILTARPTTADEARVPHRLYGHVGVRDAYTVARWLGDVAAVLDDLDRAGRPAVFVGGTGLYFTALTTGLSEVPAVPAEVRASVRAMAATLGAAGLHARLAEADPVMAERLGPADGQRVARALEVLAATGRSLSEFQGERSAPLVPLDRAAAFVVAPDRAWLRARIETRFRMMVGEGGLDEARAFAAIGVDPSMPAAKAIGVPEMTAAATGAMAVEDAIAAAVTATRQYAKRQETWFRNQFGGWTRFAPYAGAVDEMVAAATR